MNEYIDENLKEKQIKTFMDKYKLTSEQVELYLEFIDYFDEKTTTSHLIGFDELLELETVGILDLSNESIKNKIELLSLENQVNQLDVSDSNKSFSVGIIFLVLITLFIGDIGQNSENKLYPYFYSIFLLAFIPLACFKFIIGSKKEEKLKMNLVKREIAYRFLEFKEGKE